MTLLKYIYRTLRSLYTRFFKINTINYWKKRASKYGPRAVLNLAHNADEFENITLYQKHVLFPILKNELFGNEKLILDFGCGPGRFSADLANIINGKCIGVDPIKSFFPAINKNINNVEFKVTFKNKIPLETGSVDIVWICLVLGGIVKKKNIQLTILEINRVLKNDGLIFLVENVASKISGNYWVYRNVEKYKVLFLQYSVKNLSS